MRAVEVRATFIDWTSVVRALDKAGFQVIEKRTGLPVVIDRKDR